MSFLTKKEDKPEFESVSIRFEKPILERLERYQEFSNRDNRSEVVNDILRKVFETDEEFLGVQAERHCEQEEREE
jgi:metal-responsive CopG/Arc/MetJ family transcriptional regulator